MATKTGIEWTDATWNPVTGCRKVSPGCDHCYAATLAARLKAMGNPRYAKDGPDGPGFGVTLHHDKLKEPLHWRTPRRVFVNSMSDLFHSAVPDSFIRSVFETMRAADRHQFQILTKRPQRMAKLVPKIVADLGEIPKNIWLGTSIENDDYTWRADFLRLVPAAVRFLSIEPLLGPISTLSLVGIDWVIVGGESGAGHREMKAEWADGVLRACLKAKVPFFFKQWGGRTPKAGGRRLAGKEWSQFPDVVRGRMSRVRVMTKL